MLKVGDKVKMSWGQTGTVVATSGRDRTCIVKYDDAATILCSGWKPMSDVQPL